MLITVSVRRFYALFCTDFVRQRLISPQASARWWRFADVDGRARTNKEEINTNEMSSNLKIERICEWCGNRFMAQTTVTRFCSKRCSEHSYKERMRQKKMALSNQETSQCNPDRKSRDKDFLTPTETPQYLGVCWTYIYDSIFMTASTEVKSR